MPSAAEGQPQAKRLPGMLSTLPCPCGGERLVSPPGAAVTSPVLLAGAQAASLGLGPRQRLLCSGLGFPVAPASQGLASLVLYWEGLGYTGERTGTARQGGAGEGA